MKQLILTGLLLILLGACSTDTPKVAETSGEVSAKFYLNAALRVAEEALNDLDPATRATPRSIVSIPAEVIYQT